MGQKNHVNISGGVVGAVGVGNNVSVTGSVVTGPRAGSEKQEEYVQRIEDAVQALVKARGELEQGSHDAIQESLRILRDARADQVLQGQAVVQVKETLDDMWAQLAAKGVRTQWPAKMLELLQAIAKVPGLAEVAKKLLNA